MSLQAHFGGISYNVFNRRKSSYLTLNPLNFPISYRVDHFIESNYQKLIFYVYFFNIQKNPFASFWGYRVYIYIQTWKVQVFQWSQWASGGQVSRQQILNCEVSSFNLKEVIVVPVGQRWLQVDLRQLHSCRPYAPIC